MNSQLFKEPAPVFVFTALTTMAFLFIETRIRSQKKPYRDYIVYGIFVGTLSIIMLYLIQSNGKGKVVTGGVGNQPFLLDRFPN